MIQWVYEAASACRELDQVVVATDDSRIYDVVESFGGTAMMTSTDHQTGTDRLVEVASRMEEYQIVVNIQGDEPGIESDLISGVIALKKENPHWEVTTAARPFQEKEDVNDPNRVKVVFGNDGRALYFSRSPIPYFRSRPEGLRSYLHLGIYAYDSSYLMGFNKLPGSPLERAEMLEQLRVLENGGTVGVHVVSHSLPGVDTPEDLEKMTNLFQARGMFDE